MTWRTRCIAVFLSVLSVTLPVVASLKDIHVDKLPQDESVQKALAEATDVEKYASAWSNTWGYATPKDKVASALKDSLDRVQKAAVAAPNNPELLLLTGLVAHYAYNLDVPGAEELAVSSLQDAHKLAPDDYRPQWFLGSQQCQGNSVKDGMGEFLAVENRSVWNHLPPDFWDDYMFCASVANMPAHALRAGDHLQKLDAPRSKTRDFLLETAKKRFKPADLEVNYPTKEVWEADEGSDRPAFQSTMCGFSFSPLADWRLRRLEVQKGLCVAQMTTGPHAGKAGDVTPSITMIAMPAPVGETLADFMKRFMTYPSPEALHDSHCPTEACLAYEASVPGTYGTKGNGHPIMTAFRRDAPECPGLIFEQPFLPEVPKDGNVAAYHPREHLHRMEGTLYYLVMLDTADSVLDDARKDYEIFLKSMQVE